jgi:hypothetical protein
VISIPLLVGLSLLFGPPVMEHALGEVKGLVVAAPHEGYDMYSGDLARRVSKALGWGRVVAKEYRDTKLKRWINVNRPTERAYVGTKRGKERHTAKAQAVYAEYARRLRVAGGVAAGKALPLLVEIHGHNRKVKIGLQTVRLDVIECATTGFSAAELRALYARYQELAAQRWPLGAHIQLKFDRIHETYRYRGTTVKFRYKASGAREAGSLQAKVAARVLHFELPQNARSTKTQRAAFGQLLSKLLAPLAKHGVAQGAAGHLQGTSTD